MKILGVFITIIVFISLIIINDEKTSSQKFYAMGTNLTITIAEDDFNPEIFKQAFNEFKRVESIFKNKLDLNNQEVQKILKVAKNLEIQTNGVFSPYLGAVIQLWQFDKTNKTITKAPTEKQIQQALAKKQINLYSIAKGYGIDKVAELLKKNNINNFIVEAGGDLFVSGTKFSKPWAIGIKQSNKMLSCDLKEYAIATSSNLYNFYNFKGKVYGHLLNGNTGWPAQTKKAISIIANNATKADALATATFVDENLLNNQQKIQQINFIKQTDNNLTNFNLPENCNLYNFGL